MLPDTPSMLSYKEIGFTDNFGFVPKASALINGLRREIITHKIARSIHLDTIASTKEIIVKFENLIHERFGFNNRILVNNIGIASVINVTSRHDHTLYPNNSKLWTHIKEYLNENCSDNPSCIIGDKSNLSKTNMLSILKQQDINVNNIEAELGKGLKIDFKNRKILNLPESYVVIFDFDFVKFLMDSKMEDEELVAIILHEIGHVMEVFFNLNRTSINASGVLRTFLYNVNSETNSISSMRVYARENLGLDSKDTDDKTFIIDFAAVVMMRNNKHDVISYSDAEHLSDMFASGFGLSFQLGTALKKLNDETRRQKAMVWIFAGIFTGLTLGILGALIAGASGALVGFSYGFLYSIITSTLGGVIGTLTEGGSTGRTYDNIDRRLYRIRNQMVINLNVGGYSAEQKAVIIKEIDILEGMVMEVHHSKIIPKIYDKLPWKSGKANHRALIEAIEDIQSNSIIIAREKIMLELNKKKG